MQVQFNFTEFFDVPAHFIEIEYEVEATHIGEDGWVIDDAFAISVTDRPLHADPTGLQLDDHRAAAIGVGLLRRASRNAELFGELCDEAARHLQYAR